MTRLSTTARERLYDAEAAKAAAAGRGDLPICNICGSPIDGKRQRWHESHDPAIPRWLITGWKSDEAMAHWFTIRRLANLS